MQETKQKMPSVLLVEDEPKVAQTVKEWLEANALRVSLATDGAVGRYMLQRETFDVVLLDLNLPFVSGYDLCQDIRRDNPDQPIMLITALGGIEQKLVGFDVGADDYLVKPYDLRELLARIRTLLRKQSAQAPTHRGDVLKVADLVMDLGFFTVNRAGKVIELTAKEFALLEFLVRRNGRVAMRGEIIDHVWGLNFDTGTNVVDVYINFLRKKIDKDFHPKLIHTRQGMGYYLKPQEL
jgi:DNA-binding response OmpR family regulator